MSQPGDRFRVKTGFDRLDEAAAKNRRHHAHLWTILVSYGLTDQEAAHASEGIETLLDTDHLLAVTQIGCYICEQPYSVIVGKPCKGDPVTYDGRTPVYADGSRG